MTLAPGIHDIEAEMYHGDPCERPSLSASIAHVLLSRSPRHAREAHPRLNPAHQSKASGTLDNGTAAHALLFEGREATIVDASDWRTKAAQEARKEARAAGKVALLAKDAEQVKAMCEAISEQLDALDIDPRPFSDGKAEQSLVWQEPNGIMCRSRLDWLRDDRQGISDLKTTANADPREWSRRRLWEDGKDIQAAFYTRGVRALTGITPTWEFVVVENKPPYALSVISLAPSAVALAEAKVEKAIALWKECLDSGVWPGYPARTCWAELPPWIEARWLEKEILTEMGEELAA